ncbi:MAG: hypothetical protein AB8G17_15425 [Gammaproteobacteria bacterium]
MTDQYAKTLVINDTNYRPGDALAPAPAPAVATSNDKTAAPANEKSATSYPDFDDTSWLT